MGDGKHSITGIVWRISVNGRVFHPWGAICVLFLSWCKLKFSPSSIEEKGTFRNSTEGVLKDCFKVNICEYSPSLGGCNPVFLSSDRIFPK